MSQASRTALVKQSITRRRHALAFAFAALVAMSANARATMTFSYDSVCDAAMLAPPPQGSVCTSGTVAHYRAVVSDAYVPGTLITIGTGISHPDLLSLVYWDADLQSALDEPNRTIDLLSASQGYVVLSNDPLDVDISLVDDSWSTRLAPGYFRFDADLSTVRGPRIYEARGVFGAAVAEPSATALVCCALGVLALVRRWTRARTRTRTRLPA